MIYEHKAVKSLSDLQRVKPAPRVAHVRRDIFAAFGISRLIVDPPLTIAPEGDAPVTVRQEQMPPAFRLRRTASNTLFSRASLSFGP
jgi:hypothetical protein